MEMSKNKCKKLINNDVIFSKIEEYVNLIEIWNAKINLTSFKDEILWREGILESILCFQEIIKILNDKNVILEDLNWVDIGSGAGFPIILFSLINKNIKFHAIESNLKRANFLNLVKNTLNLNLEIINSRVENLERKFFDIVSARAVANTEILSNYFKKISKRTSKSFFIKGPKVFEEIKNISNKKNLKIQIHLVESIQNKKVYLLELNNI